MTPASPKTLYVRIPGTNRRLDRGWLRITAALVALIFLVAVEVLVLATSTREAPGHSPEEQAITKAAVFSYSRPAAQPAAAIAPRTTAPTVSRAAVRPKTVTPAGTLAHHALYSSKKKIRALSATDEFLICVIKHESRFWPSHAAMSKKRPYRAVRSDSGTASGAYQFIDSSWRAYAKMAGHPGYSRAKDAPPRVQDAVARWVVKNKGKYPWRGAGCA